MNQETPIWNREKVSLHPSSKRRVIWSLSLVMLIGLTLISVGCDDQTPTQVEYQPNNPMNPGGGVNPNPNQPIPSNTGLVITAPQDGNAFNQTVVRVEGRHPTAGRVQVNGQDVIVNQGQFAVDLTLEEGDHRITVSAGEQESTFVDIFVDLTPPQIQITNPRLGTHLDSAQASSLEVEGVAIDALSGVQSVVINGQSFPPRPSNGFQSSIEALAGLNQIEIKAIDQAGNESVAYRSFLFGRYKTWSSPLNEGISAFISPFALDVLEEAIVYAAQEGGYIDQLIENEIDSQGEVTVQEINYQDLDVTLTLQEGYLQAELSFTRLRVDFYIDRFSTGGDVFIERATLNTDLLFNITPQSTLDLQVRNPQLDLGEPDIHVDNVLLDGITSLLSNYIESLAQDALQGVVENVLIDGLIDPDLFRPTLSFLGFEVQLNLLVEEVVVQPLGMVITLGFGMEGLTTVNDAPGYLYQPVMSEPQRLPTMLNGWMQKNLFDMLLGQVWRGGLMNIRLSDILDEPPSALNAQLLSSFTNGALLEYMAPTDVVGVVLRPQLPPVARFDPNQPQVVIADLNDFFLDLTLPNGQVWATVGFNLHIAIEPGLTNNQLSIALSLTSEAWAVNAPLFDVEFDRLLDVLSALLQGIPNLLGPNGVNELFDLSELDLLGIQLLNLTLQTVSQTDAFALFGLDLFVPRNQ